MVLTDLSQSMCSFDSELFDESNELCRRAPRGWVTSSLHLHPQSNGSVCTRSNAIQEPSNNNFKFKFKFKLRHPINFMSSDHFDIPTFQCLVRYLICICALLLAFSSQISNARVHRKHSLKLGVLLPFHGEYSWAYSKVIPAIEYARDNINKNKTLLRHHSLTIISRDTRCSETFGPLAAIDMYMHDRPNVFLGPACDYPVAPVARFSYTWSIPVMSAGALVRAFSDKSEYRLLTRVSGSYAKCGNVIVEVLHHFNWTQSGLFYHDFRSNPNGGSSNCFFIMEAVFYRIKNNVGVKPSVVFFDESKQRGNWEELLYKISNTSRIIVLCASPESVREIMLKAEELKFDNGEYVFFNIDLFSSKNQSEKPWYREKDPPEKNERARKAYEALMTVTLRKPTSPEYHKFSEEVKRRAKEKHENFTYGEDEVNSYVGAFHDAVILYALAVNETLEANGNISNGAEITHRMWNRTFEGITGTVSIDANGDRNADYSLLDLNPKTQKFEVVANYYGNRKIYEPVPGKSIHWAGGRTSPPPDTPKCGFDGSKCPPELPFPKYGIVIIVFGSLLLIVVVAAFFIYRHIRLEAELAEMNWRVKWEDIMFGTMEKRKLERQGSRMSLARKYSVGSSASGDTIAVHLSDVGNKQLFAKTGYFKGTIVAIKKVSRTSFNINKPLLLEIKKIKDLQNDHICRFIGSCLDPPNQCLITEYCQKGSLQDVLENEQIKLDWMFRYSLMQDIVRGMAYICSTDIRSHGNLKSTNCVVDSRFVLKITDFGLHSLRDVDDDENDLNTFAYYHQKLWTAPELLRMHCRPLHGTQKGDVYSFAIIVQEIVYRSGVFFLSCIDVSPQEVYQKLKNGLKPYFRPTMEDDDCPCDDLAAVIRKCWSEDPLERPDFQALKGIIRKLNKDGDKGNILDNLLSRMEQYANNLETLVEERTADYLEQKQKAEDLLYNMLPKSVADKLIRGEAIVAEQFEYVSIYFSDICGFTAMSSESTPYEVVALLNDLYTTFDSTLETFDVYKVETIGDAYMVVSGLPIRNGNLHAREIARMSLALLDAVLHFKIRHRPNVQLKLRIGLHTGSVCAGVVGLKMPRYCLFGDTVNTASRMESNGLPLRIHISPQLKEILDDFGIFKTELRGGVEMKVKNRQSKPKNALFDYHITENGFRNVPFVNWETETGFGKTVKPSVSEGKGKITTYWLLGEESPPDVTETMPNSIDKHKNNNLDSNSISSNKV